MKKVITSTALIAGLGLVSSGAFAQTTATVTDANGGSVYSILVSESNAASIINPGDTTYTYVAKLNSVATADNVFVNTFSFGSISNLVSGSEVETGSGFTGGYPYSETTNPSTNISTVTFTADPGTGLHMVGDTATFSFDSTLPPTGLVNLNPSADTNPNGLGASKGASILGPGPKAAVPEPASLALLGLGALPLGLIARKRKA